MLSQTRTLIIITGPTAVGKTDIAVKVAKHFNAEIISADSRQFYGALPIGTAAPTHQILQEIKHHFVGHLQLDDYFNVSMFEKQVINLLEDLFLKNNIVVLTGGSGLYIKAVCEGIDELPDADEAIREMLNEEYVKGGLPALRNMLLTHDPNYARQVDLANPKRIMRALEVTLQTGRPYSSYRRNSPVKRDFQILKVALNLPREILHKQINDRVDQMIKAGLIEEARSFYDYRHLNALNTVGYKELFDYFDGNVNKDDAISKIKTNTRRYARRQITWFKKDPTIFWCAPEVDKVIEWLDSNT